MQLEHTIEKVGKNGCPGHNGNGAGAKLELGPGQDPASDVVETLCEQMMLQMGEDPAREGLVRTPQRFAKAVRELTAGYSQNMHDLVGQAVFEEQYSEMVLVRDIEFYSLCEHHVLPFFGKAHVAYIPDGKIIGLSKIPRLVNMFARRLQVQERFTSEIVEALMEILNPLGAACMVEGNHMCMMMRGVQSQSSRMVTSALTGVFQEDLRTREEFLNLAREK